MMNLNECLIAEKDKEITELKSQLKDWQIAYAAIEQKNLEHDRQVILDAAETCKTSDILMDNKPVCSVWDLEKYANKLTNGDDND